MNTSQKIISISFLIISLTAAYYSFVYLPKKAIQSQKQQMMEICLNKIDETYQKYFDDSKGKTQITFEQMQNGQDGRWEITFGQLQQILLSPKISDKTKEQFKYIYETQQTTKMDAKFVLDLFQKQKEECFRAYNSK